MTTNKNKNIVIDEIVLRIVLTYLSKVDSVAVVS